MSRLFETTQNKALTALELELTTNELVTDGYELTSSGRRLEAVLMLADSFTHKVADKETPLLNKQEFVEIVAIAITAVRNKSEALADDMSAKFQKVLAAIKYNILPKHAKAWNDTVYIFLTGPGHINDDVAMAAIHNYTYLGKDIEPRSAAGAVVVSHFSASSDARQEGVKVRCDDARRLAEGFSFARAKVTNPGVGGMSQ